MIETEVKIKLSESEFNFFNNKFAPLDFFVQKNYCFIFESGFFRIREEKGKTLLTFKGEDFGSKLNQREEIEKQICLEYDECISLFSGISKIQGEYVKMRANVNFLGCVLSLDKFDSKDIFLELEGDEEKVRNCLIELGIDVNRNERRSYCELFVKNESD